MKTHSQIPETDTLAPSSAAPGPEIGGAPERADPTPGSDLDWRDELRHSPHVRKVVEHYTANRDRIAGAMVAASLREVTLLGTAPEVALRRVREHVGLHVRAIHDLIRLDVDFDRVDFDFVRENARERARESHPLAAVLHAYRVGHRVTWESLCRAVAGSNQPVSADAWRTVMALSLFTMEYTNLVSNIAAEAYTEERRFIERVNHRERSLVLEGLLAERLDPAVLGNAKGMGLDPDGHYVVFGARLGEETAGGDGDRLLAGASRLEALLLPHSRARLFSARQSEIVGIFQADSDFVGRLERLLADGSRKWMAGSRFVVGISSARRGLSAVRLCYDDAQHALRHASRERPIVRFDAIPVFEHLIATADSAAYRIRPPWLDRLMETDRRMGGVLIETLRAHLDSHLSAKATAAQLSVHTNTVYYRLKKIEQITDQSTSNISDLLSLIAITSLHRGGGSTEPEGGRTT